MKIMFLLKNKRRNLRTSFIKRVKELISSKIKSASEEAIAYFLSFIFLLIAYLLDYYSIVFYPKVCLWFSLVLLVYGLLFYLRLRLKNVWKSFFGKLFVSAVFFVGTAISMSLAKLGVNSALEVTSSPFVYTQSLVSLLLAPIVIAALFSFVSLFVLPILMPEGIGVSTL